MCKCGNVKNMENVMRKTVIITFTLNIINEKIETTACDFFLLHCNDAAFGTK